MFLPDDLAGRHVTIMGLGTHGGGVAAVQYLIKAGARVSLTDQADESSLADSLSRIDRDSLEALCLGSHPEELFSSADLLVVNPAVPHSHPLLERARGAFIPITTELGLFWSRCRGRIIAVTGSVGKSTTATMIHEILSAAGLPTLLGGNIGRSLLPDLDTITPDHWIVLEVSSFQWEHLRPLQPRPHIAVITNLSPNHLDWHGSIARYREAKQVAVAFQQPADAAVLNADDPDVATWVTNARKFYFGEQVDESRPSLQIDELGLHTIGLETSLSVRLDELPTQLGPLDLINAAAAIAACAGPLGLDRATCLAGLERFQPLPHRLEDLDTSAGVRFFNDSKATTPAATIAALQALRRRQGTRGSVHLIAGGADKGTDWHDLAASMVQFAQSATLIGQTATAIEAAVRAIRPDFDCRVAPSLPAAFQQAVRKARAGDMIVLSPACASFGEFRDFAHRGEAFRDLVREHRLHSDS